MSDYKQVEEVVDIPPNAGVDGFLLAVRKILELPRVARIEIDNKGKITYKRWVRESDESSVNLGIDFESVTPIGAIRNSTVMDMGVVSAEAPPMSILVNILQQIQLDRLYPTVFVVGADSVFFDWMSNSGVPIRKTAETFFGYKLIKDRFVSDDTLLICASYGPGGSLVDTQSTYRLLLPSREVPILFASGADYERFRCSDEHRGSGPDDVVGALPLGESCSVPDGRRATLPIAADVFGGDRSHVRTRNG